MILRGTWTGSTFSTCGRASPHAAERTLFWEWQGERADQIAAMRGQFKLVVTGGGKTELYDVVGDPAERRDVSAEHPELTKELRDELDGLAQDRGSPLNVNRSIQVSLLNAPVAWLCRQRHVISSKGFRPMKANVYFLTAVILGSLGLTIGSGGYGNHPRREGPREAARTLDCAGGCSPRGEGCARDQGPEGDGNDQDAARREAAARPAK